MAAEAMVCVFSQQAFRICIIRLDPFFPSGRIEADMHLEVIHRRFLVHIVVRFPEADCLIAVCRQKRSHLVPCGFVVENVVVRHLAHADFRVHRFQHDAFQRQIPDPVLFQKFAEFSALCCQQDALADGFYVFLLPLGRADSRRPQRYRNHRRQTVELAHDIELFRIDLRQKFLRRDFAVERTCCQFPHLVCCFPHWGFLSKKSSNISVAALCCFIPFLSFVVQPTKVILHRKKSLFERRDKWAIPKQSLKSRRLRAK